MKILILSLLFSLSAIAQDKIKISVIDTGFTPITGMPSVSMCEDGHKDFTTSEPSNSMPPDDTGHGTHIVYTIASQLSGINKNKYCFIIMKYYTPQARLGDSLERSVLAFEETKKIGANIVNYSSSGNGSSAREEQIIKSMLDSGVKIITAAGNQNAYILSDIEDIDLKKFFKFKFVKNYPSGYDSRVLVIGNLNPDRTKNPFSNFGPRVNAWEIGTNIVQGGVKMSGTSQATAVYTGKFVRKMIQERNKNAGTKASVGRN